MTWFAYFQSEKREADIFGEADRDRSEAQHFVVGFPVNINMTCQMKRAENLLLVSALI